MMRLSIIYYCIFQTIHSFCTYILGYMYRFSPGKVWPKVIWWRSGSHYYVVFFSNTNVKQLIYMLPFKFFFNTRELQLTYTIHGNCLSIGTVLKERKNISAGFNQIWLKTGLFFFLWKIFVAYMVFETFPFNYICWFIWDDQHLKFERYKFLDSLILHLRKESCLVSGN